MNYNTGNTQGHSMTVKHVSLTSEKEQLSHILETYVEDDKGNAVLATERLRSAAVGRSIYEKMSEDDAPRERNRARVQAMVDYKPPLDQKLLNERGRHSQFNVNFGEGAAIINDATTNYVDIFTSTQTLLDIPLKHEVKGGGNFSTAKMWENILAHEFTTMVRSWDKGMFSFLELVNKFVTHGAAISLFPDKLSWMWESSSLTDFKFPHRTKATSGDVEICAKLSMMSPTELAGYIANEKAAEGAGWNVREVERVIQIAGKVNPGHDGYDTDNAEHLEEMVKANEFTDSAVYTPIQVIHIWVKEHSGKVSYYMTSRDAYCSRDQKEPEVWMFRKHEAYDNMTQAISIFPFFTGTGGNIHTIRGLGHMVYPQVQASNLMQCAMLDSARDSMSTKYITPAEKDLSVIPIVQAGPATLIPSHLQVSPIQHAPDLQRSAVPAMSLLSQQINRMSTSSALSDVFNNGQDRRSTFEVGAAIEFYSSINASAMRLFTKPWRELLVEVGRRAFRKVQDKETKAGRMADKLRRRCIARGVPEEVFDMIDWEEAVVKMPVGLGSKSARNAIFAQGTELLTEMDEVGRENFAIDRMVELFGPEQAAEYIPMRGLERQPLDTKIAQLENNQLMNGQPVEVDPSENYLAHLRVHIPLLWELRRAYEEGQMEIVDATQKAIPLWEHANETLQVAIVPEIDVDEINQAAQSLQQISEFVNNGIKAIEKQAREQAEQPQEEGASTDQIAANIKLQAKQEEHILNMRNTFEKHQQELEINSQRHQQKMTQIMQENVAKRQKDLANQEPLVRRNPTQYR